MKLSKTQIKLEALINHPRNPKGYIDEAMDRWSAQQNARLISENERLQGEINRVNKFFKKED